MTAKHFAGNEDVVTRGAQVYLRDRTVLGSVSAVMKSTSDEVHLVCGPTELSSYSGPSVWQRSPLLFN